MAAPIATLGFKIVLLLSGASFQAALPSQPGTPSPSFADGQAGVSQFIEWLRPQLPTPGWNDPPRQICVVAASPFAAGARPSMVVALYRSQPPWHALEPYAASFHGLGQQDRPQRKRTMADALRLCGAAPTR